MMMFGKNLEFRILWNSSPKKYSEHVNTQEHDVWFGVITLTFLFFIDENMFAFYKGACQEINNFSINYRRKFSKIKVLEKSILNSVSLV